MAVVEMNKPVPDFLVQATSQKDVQLSKLKGWNVVLYFYPKDNTPGCTTEGIDFKELYDDFKAAKTLIFGISKDTLKSHEHFKAQYNFPFELICDSDGYLSDMFEVIKPINMYGKQVLGMERSTFIIDQQGMLRKEWRKVRANGHADEVLEAVEQLMAND